MNKKTSEIRGIVATPVFNRLKKLDQKGRNLIIVAILITTFLLFLGFCGLGFKAWQSMRDDTVSYLDTKVSLEEDTQDLVIEIMRNDEVYMITALYNFTDKYTSEFKKICCNHVDDEYKSDCKILKDKIGKMNEGLGKAKQAVDKNEEDINSEEVTEILKGVNRDLKVLKGILN